MTRFQQYLNEESEGIDIDGIIDKLEDKCQPYLKECKKGGGFLYRGYSKSNKDGIFKLKPRNNRRPKDMPIEIHKLLDDLFKKKFGWKARSEGVFSISDSYGAGEYNTYLDILFPIGNFKYVWSPGVVDILLMLNDIDIIDSNWNLIVNLEENVDNIIEVVEKYTNKNLYKAIMEEAEVAIKCKEYYLVDMEEFDDDLRRKFL